MGNATAAFLQYNVRLDLLIDFPEKRIEERITYATVEKPSLVSIWETFNKEMTKKRILERAADAGGRDVVEYYKGLFQHPSWKKHILQGYLEIKKVYEIKENKQTFRVIKQASEESGCFYRSHMEDCEKFQKRFEWFEKENKMVCEF